MKIIDVKSFIFVFFHCTEFVKHLKKFSHLKKLNSYSLLESFVFTKGTGFAWQGVRRLRFSKKILFLEAI
jgi:hypothetical protein